jgi:hypothetical protein
VGEVLGALALSVALMAGAVPFESSIEPLSKPMQTRLKAGGFWKAGCPVALSDLRLLTVTHRDWRGQSVEGQLVVNRAAAPKLRVAFGRLYALRFPIRHMQFDDYYGPVGQRPSDVTASFHCRQAAPSPCDAASATGSWSNHAYGLAVDINPRENPYVGCGMSRDPTAQSYRDRSPHRKGMITVRAVDVFRSVGWGWGGAWSGDTKDYMHFSVNGH